MRLIDADALAKFIDYGHLNNPNEKLYSENDIREMIDMMPTIDAVPVRHGKWIKGSDTKRIKENRYGVLFDAYYCSACESEAYWDSDYGQILFYYCPNCGARMDEE